MSAIDKSFDDNFGGIVSLYIGANQVVLSQLDLPLLPKPTDALLLPLSTFETYFFQVNFVPRTAAHDDMQNMDSNGNTYKHSLQCKIHKDRTDIRAHLETYRQKKATILFKTSNGEWFLLPDMMLQAQHHTGKEPKDTNVYFFSWTADLRHQALPLSEAVSGSGTVTLALDATPDEADSDGVFSLALSASTLTNVAEYLIEYDIGAGYVSLGTFSSLSDLHSVAVANGGSMTFRVTPRNFLGAGTPIETNTVVVNSIPNLPNSVAVNQTDSSETEVTFDIIWNDNSSIESGYIVEYKVNDGSWVVLGTQSADAELVNVADIVISNGDTITARVKADHPEAEYVQSSAVAHYLLPAPPTTSDILLTGNENTTQCEITAEWTDNSSIETGFEIQYRLNAGSWVAFSSSPVAANITSITQYITGSHGDTIEFRVRAVNNGFYSDWGLHGSSVNLILQPIAPTSVAISQSADNGTGIDVDISWIDNSNNEEDFEIEYQLNSGSWTALTGVTANTESITRSITCTDEDNVRVRVRASAASGAAKSTYGNSNIIAASIETIPAAPSDVTLVHSASANYLASWTDNSDDETGFEVESQIDGGSWTAVTTTAAEAESQIVNATFGDWLKVRVRAVNGAGNSDWVESDQVPEVVSSLVLTDNGVGGSMSYTFTSTTTIETGFEMEARKNGGSYVAIETLASNDTSDSFSASDAPLSAIATDDIQIRVRAITSTTQGAWKESNIVELTS